MSRPLEIDERRVARAAEAVEAHEAKGCVSTEKCSVLRGLYAKLATAVNTAGRNAR